MAETREFEGRNLDQALFRAAQELGRAPEDLEYEILEREGDTVRIRVEAGAPGASGAPPVARIASSPADSSSPADAPFPSGPSRHSPPRGGRGARSGPAHGGRRGERRDEAPRRPPPARSHDEDDEAPWTGTPLYPDLRSMVESVLAAGDLEISADIQQDGDADRVMISGPDTELLVSDGAEALAALEHLLNKMALRGLGRRARIRVDGEGVRQRRDDEIVQMALRSAEKIKQEGGEFATSPLNPYERRLVHMALKDDPTVHTHSVGNGFLKKVVISSSSGQAGDQSASVAGEPQE